MFYIYFSKHGTFNKVHVHVNLEKVGQIKSLNVL